MNSEKRFLIAVALSFLILVLYPIYLKRIAPTPTPAPGTAVPTTPGGSAPQAGQLTTLAEMKPQVADRKESLYQFSHTHFNAEFSDRGGVITKLELKNWGKGQNSEILIERSQDKTGAFATTLSNLGVDFEDRVFSLQVLDERKGEVRFSAEEPGDWRLVKRYLFTGDHPTISLEVEVENLSSEGRRASLKLSTQFGSGAKQREARYPPESFVALPGKLVSERLNKMEKKPQVVDGEILWFALARKYFALIVHPNEPASGVIFTTAGAAGAESMRSAFELAPAEVGPSQVLRRSFLIYAGPQYYRDLKSFGHGFEQILSQGFFGVFKLWLLVALQWAHKVIGNYGWAILLVTVALKLLFTPLTHMSFESMKRMQALQPKLKALQERYKNDQAALSKEMMGLYKRNKVNPLGGCLPMALQIPIFIAFYQVLAQTVELKGEPFIFWIRDLSAPDRAWMLPFALPFLGNAINILPLFMIGSMVWQQQLTPQTAGTTEQQKIMMIMPIVFGFVFYSLPSGLVLYWFANNMLSIFHQLFIKGKALPHHEE